MAARAKRTRCVVTMGDLELCCELTPKVELRAKYHHRGEAASTDRPTVPTDVIRQRRDCQRRGCRRPCMTAITERPREWRTKYTTYGNRGRTAFRMSSSATGIGRVRAR